MNSDFSYTNYNIKDYYIQKRIISNKSHFLLLYTSMFTVKNNTFRLDYNLIEDDCQNYNSSQIEQKIIPGTITHIEVEDLDNFDQGGIDLSPELHGKVFQRICEILRTCHVNYLYIINSFHYENLLLKLVHFISIYRRLITGIDFNQTNFRDQGVKILCESLFIFIKYLILKQSKITDKGIVLLTENTWKYLALLDLGHNSITNFGLYVLIKSQSMPRLRQLRLDNIRSTRDGLKLFSKMGWALITLSLNFCRGNTQMVKIMSQKSCISLSLIKLGQQMQPHNYQSQLVNMGQMAKLQLHAIEQRPFYKPIFLFYGHIKRNELKNNRALLNLKKRMIIH